MEKQKKNIAETVRALLQPVADRLGYSIWDVEYVKEGADMILRVTIDKDGEEGVNIDDCETMHRAIDPILDEADPIDNAYLLEVSSPGVEKTISRPEHFEKCRGEKVEVRLYAALNGQKKITGILGEATDKTFTLLCPDGEITLDKSAAAKISTVFDW